MAQNGGEIEWRLNCETVTDLHTAFESPEVIRNEAESIIEELEREQGVEMEIVESSDEVEQVKGGATAYLMDFVVQVSAGVSTALIVEKLRERRETDHVESSQE